MGEPLVLLSREQLRGLLVEAAAEGSRRVLAERAADEKLLSIAAVARKLTISPPAVRHYIATGELSVIELPPTSTTATGRRRIVRVRASSVEVLIRGGEKHSEQDDVLDLAVERAARRTTRSRRGRQ